MNNEELLQAAKLPCDVTIGNITFRKGVRLVTLVEAAQRWYNDVRLVKSAAREGALIIHRGDGEAG